MTETFHVKLSTGNVAFDCAGNDTLLRAGLRQGLGLAYECNAGACGSCKFELIEGEVHDLFPEAPGIRAKEREKGKRLACQCVPLSDVTIKMRTGEEFIPTFVPAKTEARLIGTRSLTHDMQEFSFATDTPAQFLAGQYALLSIPALGTIRAYSMSNLRNVASDGSGVWQFIIRRVPNGKVSNYLFDTMAIGDSIELDGPYGIAYLRPEIARPVVCIAGGSGLAPVLSIVRRLGELHELPRPTLLYGGRGPKDIPDIAAELALHRTNPHNVDIRPIISMPELAAADTPWTGDTGFVHEFLPRTLTAPLADYEYYLAGPPPMIEACVRLLAGEHAVPSTQIHFDRFF